MIKAPLSGICRRPGDRPLPTLSLRALSAAMHRLPAALPKTALNGGNLIPRTRTTDPYRPPAPAKCGRWTSVLRGRCRRPRTLRRGSLKPGSGCCLVIDERSTAPLTPRQQSRFDRDNCERVALSIMPFAFKKRLDVRIRTLLRNRRQCRRQRRHIGRAALHSQRTTRDPGQDRDHSHFVWKGCGVQCRDRRRFLYARSRQSRRKRLRYRGRCMQPTVAKPLVVTKEPCSMLLP